MIETHLKYMKELTDKLAAIGAPIREEDQAVTLLGTELTSELFYSCDSLGAHVGDIRLDFVQQALIHEEQKLKLSNTMLGGQEDSALIGKLRKPLRYQNQKCYYCGQVGHFHRDCPKRRQQDNGRPLHKAKTAEEKVPEKQKSAVHTDFESEDEGVFAASVGSVSQMGKWLVDSGASRHMTSKREILTNYREIEEPEKVGLGDDHTVDAVGEGNVLVNMQLEEHEPRENMIFKICDRLYENVHSSHLVVIRETPV